MKRNSVAENFPAPKNNLKKISEHFFQFREHFFLDRNRLIRMQSFMIIGQGVPEGMEGQTDIFEVLIYK